MRLAWLWVSALLLVLTLVARDRVIGLWLGALLAAAALGLLMVGRLLNGLRVREALVPQEVFAGERLTLRVRVINPTLLPVPLLRVQVHFPRRLAEPTVRWLAALPPGEMLDLTLPLRPVQRGVYALGQTRLEVGDWLGLWRRAGEVPAPLRVYVFPAPDVGPLPLAQPRQLHGETSVPWSPVVAWQPVGLRPYQRGDPLRWMAWKASARHGQLMVRQFPPVRQHAHLLVLDLRPSVWAAARSGAVAAVERALGVAAAWTVRAVGADEPLGLYAWGEPRIFAVAPGDGAAGDEGPPSQGAQLRPRQLPEGRQPAAAHSGDALVPGRPSLVQLAWRPGVAQRRSVLRLLALLHPAEGPPLAPAVLRLMTRLAPGASVLWLAGRCDADTARVAVQARQAGHRMILVVAGGGGAAEIPGVTIWPLPVP